MDPYKITFTIELKPEAIQDLLTSAFEGGSNYWYCIEQYHTPSELTFQGNKERVYKRLDYPMNQGGGVLIRADEHPNENREDGLWLLDNSAIHEGLTLMAQRYHHHFTEVVAETYDAESGDIFLQLCLFGEVVFG